VKAAFAPALLAIALLAPALPAAAQQPAPNEYKIGFVSTERVMRGSRASLAATKELQAEFARRSKEISGAPAGERERRGAALNEDMILRRDLALKQFIDKTNAIVRRIAQEEKFDIVFYEASYASKRIDLTDRVIKAIDAER
jgi:outer membrane protein